MPALKRVALLALLGACEGPTLYVGDLELRMFDASEPDAAPDANSPEDARVIVRDAGKDSGPEIIVVQRCVDNDDCRDPRWPRCNTNFYVCTNCQTDRDCRQGEYCDTSPYSWQCHEDNGHKGDPGFATGGVP